MRIKETMKKIIYLIPFCTLVASSEFNIHGFGTLGLTYQNDENIIYNTSLRNNRGSDGDVSLQNDSKFGLQLDYTITPEFEATIQGTADTTDITLEWANLKYNINDNFDIKVGQMRFPTTMYSDILKVGYAYNWVRLPEDVYGILPLTSYTGAELNYKNSYKDIDYRVKIYGGRSEDTMKGGTDIGDYDLTLDDVYGINISTSYKGFELYTGFTYVRNLSISNDIINSYFANAITNPKLSNTDKALLKKYNPIDTIAKYYSIGFRYEIDEFYMLGEYVYIDMDNIISDNYAGYISMGYHYNKFTPHITFSKVTGESNYNTKISNPQIDAAMNEMSSSTFVDQEHITLGVRYDYIDNVALKLQYDHIKENDDGKGLSIHKELPYRSQNINLISFAIDFVF
jgi:hypothetical protein